MIRRIVALALGAAVAAAEADERTLRLPVMERDLLSLTVGEEFPGARGTLSVADGVGRIGFDFSQGGHYVGFRLPNRIDAGARLLAAEFRGEAPCLLSVTLRAEDEKHDVHVQGVKLKPSREWTAVTFDLGKFTGAFGRSTNAAERARIEWPLQGVCILVEPAAAGTRGSFEMRLPRLTTSVSDKALPSWSARVKAPRFGALYRPDETVELAYAVDFLEIGRTPPAMRKELRVTDWQGRLTSSCLLPERKGTLSLPPKSIGGRFGAFKAAVVGIDGAGGETEIGHTWFARLTGPNPKPAKWIGTGMHGWGEDLRRYDLMAAAGIGRARSDARWAECERKPGVYSDPNGHFAAHVRAMRERGISPVIAFTGTNRAAYPDNPLDADAHAACCEWFAKTHPDVSDFEIFNEGFYSGFRSRYGEGWEAKLAEFNQAAAPRIRAVRPDAAVLVATENWEGALDKELESGVATKDDVVSFHPYAQGKDPRPERIRFFWQDEGRKLRERMAAHGGATRCMITEVGWTTYSADESGHVQCWFVGGYPGVSYAVQAQYMVRAYLIARSSGVESMMQYDFHDDGPKRNYTEHNFGIVFQDYTPKPSFAAIAFMARLLGDAEPLGDFSADRMKYRMYGFERPDGKRVYAMWAVEDKVKVDLPADAVGGTVCDLMGNSRPLDPARTTVELTERPHYVICGGEKR